MQLIAKHLVEGPIRSDIFNYKEILEISQTASEERLSLSWM